MRDGVALVMQVHAQQLRDVGIVLDDQHAFGGFHGVSFSRFRRAAVVTIN